MAKKETQLVLKSQLQNILTGLGILLLILAAYLYLKPGNKEQQQQTDVSPEEVLVQEEGVVKKNGEEVETMSEEDVKKMQEEVDAVISTGGEKTDLKAVEEIDALLSGQAERAFSDGKFYFKLTAQNLEMAGKGYYYQGWFKKDDQYLSAGRIKVDIEGNGELYYTASVDRSDYGTVLVTLEPEDGDQSPAQVVLEGSY